MRGSEAAHRLGLGAATLTATRHYPPTLTPAGFLPASHVTAPLNPISIYQSLRPPSTILIANHKCNPPTPYPHTELHGGLGGVPA